MTNSSCWLLLVKGDGRRAGRHPGTGGVGRSGHRGIRNRTKQNEKNILVCTEMSLLGLIPATASQGTLGSSQPTSSTYFQVNPTQKVPAEVPHSSCDPCKPSLVLAPTMQPGERNTTLKCSKHQAHRHLKSALKDRFLFPNVFM